MPNDNWGVGASLLRREDDRHLHGRGEFVSDIKLPGTMDVAFVRSPHAHARVRSISVPPEARGRVFTAADLPRIKPIRITVHATGAKAPTWPPLATDKARYVGEAIAACIAPSRGEAEDLANAVSVDFEVLDAVVDAPRGGNHAQPQLPHAAAVRRAARGPRGARLSRLPARRDRGLRLDADAAYLARGTRRVPRYRGAPHPRRRSRCRRRVRAKGSALPGGDHPRGVGVAARSPGALGRGSRRASAD